MTGREEVIGRGRFQVFTDNSDHATAASVRSVQREPERPTLDWPATRVRL
jgi:hypothetical protein